ncbi:beta-propeller fold lactonase family protein [Citricoccus sp. K5]|uniref:lactonase family protein n=1 Tax=Citricoccus sp. K5 TaxID=2653135 RepID=UPI0012F3C267|nr:beta-propeller fold lactonase family protein [Citricoccus sp. K5]VXB93320.1 6-phosphogluconolactonase [Citricoccus sp. K5]
MVPNPAVGAGGSDGPAGADTVLVGTFNTPGADSPVLANAGGLVRTTGWPDPADAVAGGGPDAPSWLVRGRAGTDSEGKLYAALHLPEGEIAVLSPSAVRAPSPGNDVGWTTSQRVPTGGANTCHADLNPSGTWLAAASYDSGTLTVAPVLEGGLLGQPVAVQAPDGSGPVASRQEAPHLHFVLFLDDDRLLVTDLGADRLLEYSLQDIVRNGAGTAPGDTAGVDVTDCTPSWVHLLPAGTGPRHLALLPPLPEAGIDGRHLAVVGELDSRLHVLDLDATAGGFREVAIVPTHAQDQDPGSAQDNLPSHLVLSPDGALIYVANRGRDTIGVIHRAGTPELIAEVPCGGNWPRHLALGHPGGAPTLLVALERGDAVVGLPLDAEGIPGEARTRVTVRRPGFVLPRG